MSFDDFTIPGYDRDYDILGEVKKLYQKIMKFGSNLKNRYGGGGYC